VSFSISSIFANEDILPILVFVAETCVVTLSTVRTIFVARGRKLPAAGLGFFEVSIWLFAIGQVMQHLTSLGCYLAFASGFSLGNFLGVLIEQKLALGTVVVHVTTRKNASDLARNLRLVNFGVTVLDGEGATGPVRVVFTVIKRRQLAEVLSVVRRFDSAAFFSVNDLQSATAGIYPVSRRNLNLVPAPLREAFRLATSKADDAGAELPVEQLSA
jgi:uncharacterized protein YebE (UPF0316 family)